MIDICVCCSSYLGAKVRINGEIAKILVRINCFGLHFLDKIIDVTC